MEVIHSPGFITHEAMISMWSVSSRLCPVLYPDPGRMQFVLMELDFYTCVLLNLSELPFVSCISIDLASDM